MAIFLTKRKFLAIFLKKMSSLWQFFDSQMVIFQRVRYIYTLFLYCIAIILNGFVAQRIAFVAKISLIIKILNISFISCNLLFIYLQPVDLSAPSPPNFDPPTTEDYTAEAYEDPWELKNLGKKIRLV